VHPVRELVVSKTRTRPRVTRRYDLAQTPFHQLLDSGVLSIRMTSHVETPPNTPDPFRLKSSSKPPSARLHRVPLGRIFT
jgi:hypothetical protein